MNERILKRIANLMSVKSIVTLVLTGVLRTWPSRGTFRRTL